MLLYLGVIRVTAGAGGRQEKLPVRLQVPPCPLFWLQNREAVLKINGLHCMEMAEWFNIASFLRINSSEQLFQCRTAVPSSTAPRAFSSGEVPAQIPSSLLFKLSTAEQSSMLGEHPSSPLCCLGFYPYPHSKPWGAPALHPPIATHPQPTSEKAVFLSAVLW